MTMEQEYNIISLKHTKPKDKWLTFWRSNSAGYCWFKEWVGSYTKSEAGETNESIHVVKCDQLTPLWKEIEYEGKPRHVILNNKKNRQLLGIG